MEAFFLIFLLIFMGIIYNELILNKSFSKKYEMICALILILVSGCRAKSVGLDTGGVYWSWYKLILDADWSEVPNYFYKDWSFWYGIKALSYISDEYQFFIFICSCISIGLIARHIYKYSSEAMLTYFIFVGCGYYGLGMSMIREYLAISISLWAFDYIIKRDKKKFILIMLLASSIHITAIFFMPAYFLAHCKMNSTNIIRYLILTVTSTAMGYYLIVLATNFLFNGYYQPSGFGEEEGGKATLCMVAGVLILGIIKLKSVLKANPNNIVYYNFLWIALIIQAQTMYMSDVSRVGYYYNFFVICFIPEIIESIKNKAVYYIVYWGMILISIYIYINKMYDLNGVYPYVFFWE